MVRLVTAAAIALVLLPLVGCTSPENDEALRTPARDARVHLPVLQRPIQLDLTWPVLSEDVDREEQFFFSIPM
jgi:hypothetical protein